MDICSGCDKQYKRGKNATGTYCSNKCQHSKSFRDRYERFIAGENGIFRSVITRRKALTERDTYKCSCCGISEWNGKSLTLEVEHIDGNSSNDTSENMCFLCPNCHSQTSTYKARNKGNGRHFRRLRYADGKSY